MNEIERMNEVIHPVEKEWHYYVATRAGFIPETKKQKGFVRRYIYNHPTGAVLIYVTGYNTDYWEATSETHGNGFGYWKKLGKYVSRFIEP